MIGWCVFWCVGLLWLDCCGLVCLWLFCLWCVFLGGFGFVDQVGVDQDVVCFDVDGIGCDCVVIGVLCCVGVQIENLVMQWVGYVGVMYDVFG